jgi:adenine-specific DNA-methyltransferase
VAGPFTVESLSPHRVLAVDENDELIEGIAESKNGYGEERSFVQIILENLKTSGVQQAHKEDKITFTSITPWPGHLVCAEGRYIEGNEEAWASLYSDTCRPFDKPKSGRIAMKVINHLGDEVMKIFRV